MIALEFMVNHTPGFEAQEEWYQSLGFDLMSIFYLILGRHFNDFRGHDDTTQLKNLIMITILMAILSQVINVVDWDRQLPVVKGTKKKDEGRQSHRSESNQPNHNQEYENPLTIQGRYDGPTHEGKDVDPSEEKCVILFTVSTTNIMV